MTINRVKPLNWAFGEILTSAQMNTLDADHANAVDGSGGGDYAPTAVLGIKGKGLSVGKATGDDTYFSTANSKWAGAALDFSGGWSVALRMLDLCSYAEGRMLAVAGGAADKIARSLDDGFSWQDISSNIASPQTITLSCCAATEAIMVAAGNTAKVYYSVDTATWAFITLGGSPISITRLHYNAALNLFVAAGNTASAPYLATITTSIVGTQRTVPGALTGSNGAISIAQNTSGRMVVSWGGKTKVAWSTDGVTWNASTNSFPSGSYRVAYGDGVFLLTDGSVIYSSTDGDVWTTSGLTVPSASSVISMTNLSGVFAAMDSTLTTYISVDKGVSWKGISSQVVGYSSFASIRAVRKRLHILLSDGTNALDLRSRRLGYSDGTV